MKTKHFIIFALVVGFIAGITVSATAADTLGLGLLRTHERRGRVLG